MINQNCPDPEEIIALLLGETSEVLLDHLSDCESCRKILETQSGGKIDFEQSILQMIRNLGDSDSQPFKPMEDDLSSIGHYQIVREIGRGGMGIIYEGWDSRLDRRVAVKTIRQHSNVPDLIRRIRREARLQSALNHPNIVTLHEFGIHRGLPYIIMELVYGQTLKKRIQNSGPLSSAVAAELIGTVAKAMDYMHEMGIVHRDLKASNILLASNSDSTEIHDESSLKSASFHSFIPKITDFGLSVSLLSSKDQTNSDANPGTLAYMAPEQLDSSRAQVSPASDIYSMGIILYECLTGHPPFVADNPAETIRMILELPPPSPRTLVSGIPRDIETICLKCLDKKPARRYSTSKALAEDIDRFINGEPILARPLNRLQKLKLWVRRYPAIAASMTISLLSLITLAVESVLYASNQSQLRQKAMDEATRSRQSEIIAIAAEKQAKTAEDQARKIAKEARAESDLARNNFFMGLNYINDLNKKLESYEKRPPDLKETLKLKIQSKKMINTMIDTYINRSTLQGEPSSDMIDRLFLDGVSIRDFGEREKAILVFNRLINLASDTPPNHPDLLHRQAAAIRSAHVIALMLINQGLQNDALKIVEIAWKQWPVSVDQAGVTASILNDHSMLGNTYIKLLRSCGRSTEADRVEIQLNGVSELLSKLGKNPSELAPGQPYLMPLITNGTKSR